MNSNAKINDEKRLLLNDLINVTREITSKYNGGKQVVTEAHAEVEKLLQILEKCLCYGLKNSILSNVQELFSSSSSINFWSFAQQHLTKHEQERFSSYKNVSRSIANFRHLSNLIVKLLAMDGSRENKSLDKKFAERTMPGALSSHMAFGGKSQ